jgi:tetratricopeptide (TPR) repeat protein
MGRFKDIFGQSLSAERADTIEGWNRAILDYFTFKGDPVSEALELAHDRSFVMGDVFAATMLVFDGATASSPQVSSILRRLEALHDAVSAQEQGHIRAVRACAEGGISLAAGCWDRVLMAHPLDIVAMKLAHEAYFLIGDANGMLRSVSAALPHWRPDMKAYGFLLGQHAFGLEECHQYAAAEGPARLALELEPDDCWALHALTHVYEMQGRHFDCLSLLDAMRSRWVNQPLLAAHIWWHLALRYVADGRFEQALAVYDEQLAKVNVSSAFRLTDGTSLLWRLELAGASVGDRWAELADKWSAHAGRHANGFLDVHIAMALAAAGRQSEVERFLAGFNEDAGETTSELGEIRRQVTAPACRALVAYRAGDDRTAIGTLASLLPALHRIGGSNAQRDLFDRTLSASMLRAGELARSRGFLLRLLAEHPNAAWVLDDMATLEAQSNDPAMASVYRARASLAVAPIAENGRSRASLAGGARHQRSDRRH